MNGHTTIGMREVQKRWYTESVGTIERNISQLKFIGLLILCIKASCRKKSSINKTFFDNILSWLLEFNSAQDAASSFVGRFLPIPSRSQRRPTLLSPKRDAIMPFFSIWILSGSTATLLDNLFFRSVIITWILMQPFKWFLYVICTYVKGLNTK